MKGLKIPTEVSSILKALDDASFEAHIVGGCVRDLILGNAPKDWDVTTNATPEKLQELFPDNFYDNAFGTVSVKTGSEDPTLAIIQITPYRIEGKYTDKRHPSEISFAKTLDEDLSRRDFTVNAIAMDASGQITDPHNGQEDIEKQVIRTVGNPDERFGEDALRILRAVRFSSSLGFTIESATLEATKKHSDWLIAISKERIRDEFLKIIDSPLAHEGVDLMREAGIMEHVIPELLEGVDVGQNLHHIYTVWEHNLRALKYTVEKKYSLVVRLAALLHDVGKPRTKRGEGKYSTFYGHDAVGARMTIKIADRLKFSGDIADRVTRLVRYHMFYYNVGEVTESSVRRLLMKVGPENMDDLLRVREADRIGSGTPKAVPYKLRHLKYVIDKVSHDPISVKMLKVRGDDIMKILDIPPGPKIGLILNSLLAEILDDPALNTAEWLDRRVKELNEKSPEELRQALARIEEAQEEEEEERMKKYYV